MANFNFSIFLLLLTLTRLCLTVNVVVFLPGTTDHERKNLNRLAQELALRNHRVCAFKAVIVPEQKFLVQPRLHDVRELKLKPNITPSLYESVRDRGNRQSIWNSEYDAGDRLSIPLWTAYARACESILDSDLMDRLKDELYDVAVVYKGNPCHLGIVHALAMPFIYYDTEGFSDELVVASALPWISSLPLSTKTITNRTFDFTKRLLQLGNQFLDYIPFTDYDFLKQFSSRWSVMDSEITRDFRKNRELKKRFVEFPDVNRIKKLASAYFVNSDQALDLNGRPNIPNLVYVGGLHFEYPRPMFAPFNETNALAKDGVVILSMGTSVNGTCMPSWMKRAFLKAFSRFPLYRFYWRLGSSTLGQDIDEKEIPRNINFTQHVPQNDLLAADETALLISNGGANSIMEALNYGVPVLGVPLYGVNYDNLKKLESKGAAIIVHKSEISARSIYEAMRKLLKDDKYFVTAQRLSRVYKDRQMTALETAIHWVEYVGRHHGARYKQFKSLNRLPLYQYLMLDVFALYCICVSAFVYGTVLVWRMCTSLWSKCGIWMKNQDKNSKKEGSQNKEDGGKKEGVMDHKTKENGRQN